MADQNRPDIILFYQDGRLASEFVVEAVIGQGGFGTVSRAHNRIDLKHYAIKKINVAGLY
jgi:serine/threonine protein kinase